MKWILKCLFTALIKDCNKDDRCFSQFLPDEQPSTDARCFWSLQKEQNKTEVKTVKNKTKFKKFSTLKHVTVIWGDRRRSRLCDRCEQRQMMCPCLSRSVCLPSPWAAQLAAGSAPGVLLSLKQTPSCAAASLAALICLPDTCFLVCFLSPVRHGWWYWAAAAALLLSHQMNQSLRCSLPPCSAQTASFPLQSMPRL